MTTEQEMDIHARCQAFVAKMFTRSKSPSRPWVTVAYAQSMDGRIAAQEGQPRLILSGKESMLLTFHLRNQHDAVLVTWKTLEADDSQLTVREIPGEINQPQVVILDLDIQSSRSRCLFSSERNIWIACSETVFNSSEGQARAAVLHATGASFIPLPCMDGRISLQALLATLHDQYHLASIFIEAGLRFLPYLLSQKEMLDAIVVTIAPKLIGSAGRAPVFDNMSSVELQHFETLTLDEDITFGSWVESANLLDQLHMSKSVCLANRLCSVHRVPVQEDVRVPPRLAEGLEGWVVVKRASTMTLPQPHNVAREVKILQSLRCAQIVPLLDYAIVKDYHHLIMPYYPLTLTSLLDDPTFTPQGSLHFAAAAQALIRQICLAVEYIHAQGVAHRDINPSNFVIGSKGQIVLIDFGIAYAGPTSTETADTMCCDIGTGACRAPELLFGYKSYDPFACDIWALGVTIAAFFTDCKEPPAEEDQTDDALDTIPLWAVQKTKKRKPTRSMVFRGDVGDIALIGSIFNVLGTPTTETWPESKHMPDFERVVFADMPAKHLEAILPNLPTPASAPADFVMSMLKISAGQRVSASAAAQLEYVTASSADPSTLLQAWLDTAMQGV